MLHLPQKSNIQLKSEIFWPILQLWHDKTIFHIVWKSLNNVAFWRDFAILFLSETYFEDLATAYVLDHFNATEHEIDKSGDGVSYGQAFCTLGNNNYISIIVDLSSTF